MSVVGERAHGATVGAERARQGRLGAWWRAEAPVGRERALLAGAILLGLAAQLAYILATRHLALAGDEPEYVSEARLIAHGHLFYTTLPYGILHAGAWKAPLYPAWLGLIFAVFGEHLMAVKLLQLAIGLLTIPLTWLLARRLFSPRLAIVAAFAVAIYPMAWQFEGLVYPEALATPLYVLLLVLALTRPPTVLRATGIGLLMGLALLLRPTTEFLFLGFLIAWSLRAGWRRGVGLTVLSLALAVLVVAPWTIRNEIVMHGFVPISMQDSAAYGTFNAQSANDSLFPYAWRADPPSAAPLFNRNHPLPDPSLRSRLDSVAIHYIEHHPGSVPLAFFWNGLSRLWDIRHQSRALAEVPYEGRSRTVTEIGLDAYYVLFVLALVGLWRARERRWLVLGVLGLALGASIVFTVDSGTRYRAPLEPLIVALACAGALGAATSGREDEAGSRA